MVRVMRSLRRTKVIDLHVRRLRFGCEVALLLPDGEPVGRLRYLKGGRHADAAQNRKLHH